jgi:membrane protease YdiL (CAAX protease family)
LTLERLDGKDARILLTWVLAGVIGAVVAHTYFFRAFPEASVEFKIPRAEALAAARQFATAQGARLEGYDSTIIFTLNDTAKTYLEREVGLQQANRMMAGDVHVWYWRIRFFRPLQKEEFEVLVSPAGGIVGYAHVFEDAAPGAHLERAEAQAIAASFLRDALHADLSRYDFREEEANPTERPARRDWSFSWERRGFRAKDAPYRLSVALAGARVSEYREFLKVPEAWEIGYERLRSSNDLFEYVALIPYAFLLGGCLYVIISLGRRGLLEWRAGLALGAFLAVLYFVMTMNQWPLDRAEYDTNTPYPSFILSRLGLAAVTSIASAILVVLAVVPGEPLYRVLQPDKLRLNLKPWFPGWRTKEFFRANVIGICLAAVHIGYLTLFYIISRNLGAWSPQDLNYENVVSTSLPWVYPLTIGIYAATSEEFLFRLFAIPFLSRVTRSKWLAVVLPAFFWGFLHSNYPQEPGYIRGIEVGLMGIVAGLVMLRWGIWATLTWHYTVDAFLISTSLLRSHGAYLQLSGAIVGGGALIPLAIATFFYFSRGGFVSDVSLLNRAHPLGGPALPTGGPVDFADRPPIPAAPEAPPEAPSEASRATADVRAVPTGYAAMSSRSLFILAACGVLGAAALFGIKREVIGDFVRFQIDAREATARADEILRRDRIDPLTYHRAATITYTYDGYANEYLRRTIGIAGANEVYRREVPSAFWAIRYFRDSQNEEYLVVLKPDGSLHSLHHTLDEKAPGANLSKEEAQTLAENYLRAEKNVNLSDWNLVEANTDKKPARTDHVFEWEQKSALDARSPASPAGEPGAHVRMQLRVQGDEVSGYRIFIKIPEAWRDAESRTSPLQLVQTFGLAVGIGAVFVFVLVIFLRNLRNPALSRIAWRRLGLWSLWVLLATLVLYVNQIPQLLAAYLTSMPLAMYSAAQAILRLFGLSLDFAGVVLLLGIAWFFLEREFGPDRIPSWSGMSPAYYRDAFCVALFGAGALMGLNRLPALFAKWPLWRHTLASATQDGLDWLNPASGNVASAISGGFVMVGLVGLAAGLVAAYVRAAWMRALLLVLYAALTSMNVATPGAFLRDAAFRLVLGAAVWFGASRIVRFNMLGYFLLAATITLVPGTIDLLEQPNPYFRAHGVAVLACAIALLAWPLALWKRPAGQASAYRGSGTIG